MAKLDLLSVLIADDEHYICKLLEKIIRWDELSLKLRGTFSNGADVFKAIIEQRPQIVITDISMPKMDGLELIEQTYKLGIPCKFIIVSGYRHFEYAYNALKYNVEDYILKPIDEDELNNALRRLVQEIKQKNRGSTATPMGDSQDQIRKLFFNRIIEHTNGKGFSLENIKQDYGIEFQVGLFQVLCIKLDITKASDHLIDDTNSLHKKFASLCKHILGSHCYEILIDIGNENTRIGLNYNPAYQEDIERKIREYFNRAQNIVELFPGLEITMGVGNTYTEITNLKKSEAEALGSIWCRIVEGTGEIIYWSNLLYASSMLTTEEKTELLTKISREFEILDHSGFSTSIRSLFQVITTKFSGTETVNLLNEIIDLYFATQKKMIDKYQNGAYLLHEITYGIKNATSLFEMERALVQPITQSMQAITKEVEKENIRPVRQAIEFIENNFGKPLKLADVAEYIELNPAYFSNMFKKETGKNFSDFLTDIRMNKAKDLLRYSKMNIGEIADSVGYTNARYFSRLFRNVVGIRPSEYRKIYG